MRLSGFKRVRRHRLTMAQTYTGLPIQNRGLRIKSWTKWAQFRPYPNRDGGSTGLLRLDAGAGIFLHHELGPCQFRKTAAFCHQFIESSAFDHAAVVEHQDARGVADG